MCLNKIYLGALPEVLPTNDSTSFYLFRGYRAELWNDVKKHLYTAMARWRKSHSVTWIARWPWMPANSVCGSQPVVLPLVSCLWPTACLFVSLFPLSFPRPPVTLSLTASSHSLSHGLVSLSPSHNPSEPAVEAQNSGRMARRA